MPDNTLPLDTVAEFENEAVALQSLYVMHMEDMGRSARDAACIFTMVFLRLLAQLYDYDAEAACATLRNCSEQGQAIIRSLCERR